MTYRLAAFFKGARTAQWQLSIVRSLKAPQQTEAQADAILAEYEERE